MKKFIIALSLIGLAGCAAPPPGPPNYGSRVYGQTDPAGWQTVSVTQVPVGTGARFAAQSNGNQTATVDPAPAAVPADPPATTSSTTTTTSTSPVYVQQPIYVQQPVYVPAPVYTPAPVYYPAPAYYPPSPYYWWPPISIGLGFSWSHWDGGGHGHGWGGHGWGGHGWSGGHGGSHGHH